MIDPQAVSGDNEVEVESSSPVVVSDPRVQAALERIADSAGIDLEAMPQVLEDVYRRLNSALADEPGDSDPSEASSSAEDAHHA